MIKKVTNESVTQAKRKRGRPKGSKNKKKKILEVVTPKRKRGRPPGSKNKPKVVNPTKKKPGRPRIHKTQSSYPKIDGVSLVVRKTAQGITREWVVYDGIQVIGYYKHQDAAAKALKEIKKP